MMLVVVSEKVAAQHRKEVIFPLCSGAVETHCLCVRKPVGKVCADKKQLE
jgi:hypothetical protein